MKSKILIAYASKHGATKDISERIGKIIKDKKMNVDVSEIRSVNNLSEYSEVILGSSLYIGRWDKRMVRFVKNNKEFLKSVRVWIFTSGPTEKVEVVKDLNEKHMSASFKDIVDYVNPINIACFSGFIDVDKLSFFEKWIIKNVGAPIGDFRDWNHIETWANGITLEQQGQ